MTTIMLTSAALVIAVTAGIPVGVGLAERSFLRSWKLLAQQRRQLNERERAINAALVKHYRCKTCKRSCSVGAVVAGEAVVALIGVSS